MEMARSRPRPLQRSDRDPLTLAGYALQRILSLLNLNAYTIRWCVALADLLFKMHSLPVYPRS